MFGSPVSPVSPVSAGTALASPVSRRATLPGRDKMSRMPATPSHDVLHALSVNPAAPYSVFARLLALDPLPNEGRFLSYVKELTPARIEAVVAHPDPTVRGLIVDNMFLDPALLLRFLDDPDVGVRARAVCYTSGWADHWRKVLVPDAVLSRLARDPEPQVRRWVPRHQNLAEGDLAALTGDADDKVRAAAEAELAYRRKAAAEPEDDWEEPDPAADGIDLHRFAPAGNCGLADDPDLTPERRAELAESDDLSTRIAISLRPELTDAERLAIRDTVHPYRHAIPRWILAAQDDPDALRRIASSAHPLMRRSVAAVPRLPADVIAALAADDDFYVRLTLVQHCDDAPGDVVLDTFANWHGLTWGVLQFRPAYPWYDVERLAAHPSPRVRTTAATSDYLTPELALQLTEDDDQGVRDAALRSPHLPLDALPTLLSRHPGAVAANPNLPWHVMHRLLDELGVPAFEPPSFPLGSRLGDKS